MPKNPGELIDKIVGVYESFFEVWNTSLISETMKAPKWLVNLFESLLVGDIVYFKKIEDDVSSSWIVGKVVSLESGGDGIPRRAEVEYHNLSKFFAQKHITDRAARSLVKLFNIEDLTWKDDMAEVERVKTDVNLTKSNQTTVENARKRLKSNSELGSMIGLWLDKKLTCKESCCISHLNMCSRDMKEIVHKKCDFQFKDSYPVSKQTEFVNILDRSWDTVEKQIEEMSEYNYVFPGLVGVLAVTNKFLEIQ